MSSWAFSTTSAYFVMGDFLDIKFDLVIPQVDRIQTEFTTRKHTANL